MEWGFALASFGGALVEFVEAAIIVIAAAGVANWRPALKGAGWAALILVAVVAVLGPTVGYVPLTVLRAITGGLLMLFGVKWLAKATFRLSRQRPTGHHDSEPESPRLAFMLSFNGVLLEGAEVVFIVLALGTAGRALASSIIGAAVACVLILIGAVAARGPLAKVPDIALKYGVGIMLTSFGTLWLGEALGVPWWGHDAAVLWLIAGNLVLSWIGMTLLRQARLNAERRHVPAEVSA